MTGLLPAKACQSCGTITRLQACPNCRATIRRVSPRQALAMAEARKANADAWARAPWPTATPKAARHGS